MGSGVWGEWNRCHFGSKRRGPFLEVINLPTWGHLASTAMTSNTCILFDLPTQRDAVEKLLRDETQQSIINTVKGRFWCYFLELDTWLPLTTTVRVDPRTLDIMTQGALIKETIKTEMSEYYRAELTIFNCYGQSPHGAPIGDDDLVHLIQWIYVRKTEDGVGAAVRGAADAEPEHPAVDMSEIETWVHYGDEWKKVMMPNLEGPTQGRLFVNVSRLKREALEKFEFKDVDEVLLRAADLHYNDGGEIVLPALKLNERIIHGKWYSLVVDKGMVDFALEGEQ